MEPTIEKYKFGVIRIAGETYEHDVLLRWDGKVRRRKSRLSKKVFGTAHKVSLDEAKQIYKKGVDLLIFGTGRFEKAQLSDDARRYFEKKGVRIVLAPTGEAIKCWNEAKGRTIGLFHLTC